MKNFFYICGVKAFKDIVSVVFAPIWIPTALVAFITIGAIVSATHFVASKKYTIPSFTRN